MGQAVGCCLFPSALGSCGIAWTPSAIAAVQLPEATPQHTLARLRRHLPQAAAADPPVLVADAIRRIQALLAGERDDLANLPLDFSGLPPFHQRVYALVRTIPPGATVTYGELAQRLGQPLAARAVGQALGHNPFAPVVPCHRVLAAGGRPGGFSASGGTLTKLKMLQAERAWLGGGPGLFD